MNQKKTRSFLSVLFLFLICTFLPTLKADAGYDTEPYWKSTYTQNSITISWSRPDHLTSDTTIMEHRLTIGRNNAELAAATPIVLSGDASTYTFTNLKPETEYAIQLEYIWDTDLSSRLYVKCYTATLPLKTKNVHQDYWFSAKRKEPASISIKWDDKDAVTGFEYIIKDSKGKVVKRKKTYNNDIWNCKVKDNAVYTIQVRAYTNYNQKPAYGAWSDTAYLFPNPTIKKLSIKNGKLNIKWSKITGATSYDVYVSTKQKKGYKKVATVKAGKDTVTISKLGKSKFDNKKTYYVYLVTNKKVGKKTYHCPDSIYASVLKKGKLDKWQKAIK